MSSKNSGNDKAPERRTPGLDVRGWSPDALLEIARALRKDGDIDNFQLGDIAREFCEEHGDQRVFAEMVGISEAKCSQVIHTTAFFPLAARVQALEDWPDITWMHFLHAQSTLRQKHREASPGQLLEWAMELLEHAMTRPTDDGGMMTSREFKHYLDGTLYDELVTRQQLEAIMVILGRPCPSWPDFGELRLRGRRHKKEE